MRVQISLTRPNFMENKPEDKKKEVVPLTNEPTKRIVPLYTPPIRDIPFRDQRSTKTARWHGAATGDVEFE